jgi:hypothetical protein
MKFNIQNHITNILPLLGGLVGLLLFASCQEWDVDRAEAALQPLSEDSYTSQLNGDDLVWTWSGNNGTSTQVNVYNNGSFAGSEVVNGNSYTFTPAYTNVNYTFVFKQTDGTNYSSGVVKKYLREGATQISGISMSQVDKVGGYDATVTWNAATDATSIKLIATNGKQTINETLAGTATSYTIKDVTVGDTSSKAWMRKRYSQCPMQFRLRLRTSSLGIKMAAACFSGAMQSHLQHRSEEFSSTGFQAMTMQSVQAREDITAMFGKWLYNSTPEASSSLI